MRRERERDMRMAVKVQSRMEAWSIVNRLCPIPGEKNEKRSEKAGCPVYRSENYCGEKVWIYAMEDRMKLCWDNGMTDIISFGTDAGGTAITVGMYVDRTVFGEAKIREVKEIPYVGALGLVYKTLDDGRPGIEISLENGTVANFGCENVAYIKFG